MRPIVFLPEADKELEASVDYDETRRAGLGSDFRAAVESKIRFIQQDPQRWAVFGKTDARKCHLKRFPYSIIYYDSADKIWIVAVAHQKRKPGYWRDRRPGE